MAFTFTNKDNLPPKTKPVDGDYQFTVVGAEAAMISAGSLSGTSKWELEIEFDGHPEFWNATVDLVEHKDHAWRFDTFCKCTGVQIKEGEAVELNFANAKECGFRWINVVGLRGWCRAYQQKDKNDSSKVYTRLVFYTDKPKLPPNAALQQKAEAEAVKAYEDANPSF